MSFFECVSWFPVLCNCKTLKTIAHEILGFCCRTANAIAKQNFIAYNQTAIKYPLHEKETEGSDILNI